MRSLRTVLGCVFVAALFGLSCGPSGSGSGSGSDLTDTGGTGGTEDPGRTGGGDLGPETIGTTVGDTTTATVGSAGGLMMGQGGIASLWFPVDALT